MRLILVRHGTTTWTDARRYTGRSNPPLTAEGRRQAADVGRFLAGLTVDLAVVSPLQRCVQTYELIRPKLASVGEERYDARAQEIFYGDWEGRTRDELLAHNPTAFDDWDSDPTRRPPPGGESALEVAARITSLMAEMLAANAALALLVSHRTVLRILTAQLLGMPLASYRNRLDHAPAAISVLDVRAPDDGKLLLYNLRAGFVGGLGGWLKTTVG